MNTITSEHPDASTAGRTRQQIRELAAHYSLQIILLLAVVLVGLFEPQFFGASNLRSVLLQSSFGGLLACGMTLLIVGGMIDLSVAGTLAVTAVTIATVLPRTTVGIAMLLAVVAATLMGLLNGLVVTRMKIPAFIATLGMLNIYLAVAFIWTNGKVQPISSNNFMAIGQGTVAGLPIPFLVFAIVCGLSYWLLQRTPFGRNLRAVGSSEAAARMAGIRVDRVLVLAFMVAGVFAGLAAITLSALLSSASGTMATGIELNAIAIAVVGGTSLRGGNGTMLGTFTGALLFSILNSALNLFGVASYWQPVAVGTVLVLALAIGARRSDGARGDQGI